MTCRLPSSLSRDASHTTGRRDARWPGAGPFPEMSGEGEDGEEERDALILRYMSISAPPDEEKPSFSFFSSSFFSLDGKL